MGLFKPRPELSFLRLQKAVFCVQCELIHENNTANCLACGSSALLSVSRIFGGELGQQPRATLLQDAAMERLVRDLIESVPPSPALTQQVPIAPATPRRSR